MSLYIKISDDMKAFHYKRAMKSAILSIIKEFLSRDSNGFCVCHARLWFILLLDVVLGNGCKFFML